MDWKPFIHTDTAVCGGRPVIKGTRVTVEIILENLAQGATGNDLLRSYPHLPKEAGVLPSPFRFAQPVRYPSRSPQGGHRQIASTHGGTRKQLYFPDTNVPITRFLGEEGVDDRGARRDHAHGRGPGLRYRVLGYRPFHGCGMTDYPGFMHGG